MTDISQTQAGCKAKSRRNPLWISRPFNTKSRHICRNRRYFRRFRHTILLYGPPPCLRKGRAYVIMSLFNTRSILQGKGAELCGRMWKSFSAASALTLTACWVPTRRGRGAAGCLPCGRRTPAACSCWGTGTAGISIPPPSSPFVRTACGAGGCPRRSLGSCTSITFRGRTAAGSCGQTRLPLRLKLCPARLPAWRSQITRSPLPCCAVPAGMLPF